MFQEGDKLPGPVDATECSSLVPDSFVQGDSDVLPLLLGSDEGFRPMLHAVRQPVELSGGRERVVWTFRLFVEILTRIRLDKRYNSPVDPSTLCPF